jgi:transposase
MLEDFPLLLLLDNARPHTAKKTDETLRNFKWEVFEYPPYSPDLASSDFHLFGPLKHHLSAEHFSDGEAVEREVTAWLEIMLRNKSIFEISTHICLSYISICNLLIDLPSYI